MGAIAFFTSGAVLYNPLSASNGSLASYYEWSTLDPCYGHSSVDKQYHYHAVSFLFKSFTNLLKDLTGHKRLYRKERKIGEPKKITLLKK
jgi:hypothetical protein